MKLSARFRKPLIFLSVVGVLVWCAMDIDWSTFRYFSWGSFRGTLASLLHPDWSAFYTGSTEDIFSLMIMTIAIGFFGTSVGTVLAIPFTLLSAQNLWKNPVTPRIGKFVLDVLRAFPELVEIARQAFTNESGAALIKKYGHLNDELFTEAGFKA